MTIAERIAALLNNASPRPPGESAMSDEIKPLNCPFCGLEPEIEPWHGGGKRKHAVSCPHVVCAANPMVTGPTKRAAINLWNLREQP